MAVKQNRLLRQREREDSCAFFGERITMCDIFGGKGGKGVAIHFPSLQQNESFSPSSKRARHFWHVLDQLGGIHLHRFIANANLHHHGCRSKTSLDTLSSITKNETDRRQFTVTPTDRSSHTGCFLYSVITAVVFSASPGASFVFPFVQRHAGGGLGSTERVVTEPVRECTETHPSYQHTEFMWHMALNQLRGHD